MQAKAINRMVRISPNKVRLVIDLVRGKEVERALAILRYMPQKAAKEMYLRMAGDGSPSSDAAAL